jgi:hypothetical protein
MKDCNELPNTLQYSVSISSHFSLMRLFTVFFSLNAALGTFKRCSDITKTEKMVYCIRQYTELPMALFQDLLEKNGIGSPLTPRIISRKLKDTYKYTDIL